MATTDELRTEVEQHLDEQAEMLTAVRDLIEDRVPFDEWPETEQAAFLHALQPPKGTSDFEAMKAHNLCRHLFRQDIPAMQADEVPFERLDLSDRIRADLSGLVRLGAGRHLIEALEAATSPSASI